MNDVVTPSSASAALYGPDGKLLRPDESEADREIFEWQRDSAYYVPPPEGEKYRHIVDILIKERAPKLSQSRFWPLLRVTLNNILGYHKGLNLVDKAGRMEPHDAFAYASQQMGVQLEASGIEHIPKEGGFIFVVNHPTGIADGLAAHDLISQIRPDPIVFVNGDAIRLNPRLTEKLIPVEWRPEKKNRAKSRETLKASNKAFAEGRAIVLFPSGRLAYMDDDKQLRERPWMSSVAALAKKYQVPIIPAHLQSRNSWLYYLFWRLNEELRDMTLFHELFNKKGKVFRFSIQGPIQPSELIQDNEVAADELRQYVEHGIQQGLKFQDWREIKAN